MLKRKLVLFVALAVMTGMFTSCINNFNSNGSNDDVPEMYKDFYNYPTGKQSSSGTLTLKNGLGNPVLCFVDSVDPANYIGTVGGASEIQVKLEPGKFYSIVSVSKDAYEEKGKDAKQSSELTYYDAKQAYAITVNADGVAGGATLIINNPTNYWASIENINGSGERFAVVKPGAQRVSVPIKKNENYDYKVVYLQELKYKGNIMGIVEKTTPEENDTISTFELDTFTLTLDGPKVKNDSDLAPALHFTNSTGKTLRVYNGQVQLCNYGVNADDYSIASGVTALFTGLADGTNSKGLKVNSISFGDSMCPIDMKLEAGKVYNVNVTKNDDPSGSDPLASTNPCIWDIVEVDAEKFYDQD